MHWKLVLKSHVSQATPYVKPCVFNNYIELILRQWYTARFIQELRY